MGVDSRAFLPDVSKEDIKNFISLIANKVSLENSGVDEEYKILTFLYKGEDRRLNLQSRYLKKEDYIANIMKKYLKDRKTAEKWWEVDEVELAKLQNVPLGKNGTYCSFGYWGRSVEILTILCHRFGGYLDESDSDDKEYEKIKKDYREIIKKIYENR